MILMISCVTQTKISSGQALPQPDAVRVSRGAQELMHGVASSLFWPWSGQQKCVFFEWNVQKEEINLSLGIGSFSFGILELTSTINNADEIFYSNKKPKLI